MIKKKTSLKTKIGRKYPQFDRRLLVCELDPGTQKARRDQGGRTPQIGRGQIY